MAASDSDISICSEALILLGASAISSFTEGTPAATACSALYPGVRDTLLARYMWSWSLKKTQIFRLSTDPTNEWKYAYQLPADVLSGAIALFDNGGNNAQAVNYGWEVYEDKIFTNLETVYIDYQYSVPEAKMPTYFVKLLRTALASELAIVVTDQVSKADYFRNLAYGTPGENGRGGLFREATNIDSRGQVTKGFDDFTLIEVRY